MDEAKIKRLIEEREMLDLEKERTKIYRSLNIITSRNYKLNKFD